MVVDTSGDERIVGVFSDEAAAKQVMLVNPAYYRIESLRIGEINPKCLDWICEKPRRDTLRSLLKKQKN